MPKPKDTPVFDLDAAMPALVSVLQTRRMLKKSELKAFQVPTGLHQQVLDRLVGTGFEGIKNGVRVPLRLQLITLLQERMLVSGALGKHLKGGSPKEYKVLLNDLAKEGSIHLLVRGKVEAVTGEETPVLSREAMRALGQLAVSVQKALRGKPMPRTLLEEDVRELLLDLVRPSGSSVVVATESPDPPLLPGLVDLLVIEAHRLLKPDMGLCFVPDLVLSQLPKYSLSRIQAALVLAVRERRIELRPEAGMNRLSPLELALCPEGLQETRLSWARPLETKS